MFRVLRFPFLSLIVVLSWLLTASWAMGAAPTITTHPQSRTVSYGESASFSVSASGTSPLTYQWFKDDQPIVDATDFVLFVRDTTTASNGSYTVVVTNAEGSAPSNPAVLEVTVRPPQITSQPSFTSLTSFVGDESIFFSRVRVVGDELTLEWRKDGLPLATGERTWPYFERLQKSDSGTYQLFASSPFGSVESKLYTLEVLDHLAPVFTVEPRAVTAPLGTRQYLSATIQATSTTNHPLVLQWFHDGVPIPYANYSQLVFSTLRAKHAGSYYLRASNLGGVVDSVHVDVNVTGPAPDGYLPLPWPNTDANAVRLTWMFSIDGGQPAAFQPRNLSSLQWYRNGVAVPGETDETLEVPRSLSNDAAEYFLERTDATGSSISITPASLGIREGEIGFGMEPDGVDQWGKLAQWDNLVYVSDAFGEQVFRYNLSTGEWLAPVVMNGAVRVMQRLGDGLYCVMARTNGANEIVRFNQSLSQETSVLPFPSGTFLRDFYITNDYVAARVNSTSETIQFYSRGSSPALTGTIHPFNDAAPFSFVGLSSEPRVFFLHTSTSPVVGTYRLGEPPDAGLQGLGGGWGRASRRLVLSPDEKQLASIGGPVIDTASFEVVATVGRPATDLAFLPDGSGAVYLHDNRLTRVDGRWQETATAFLPEGCDRVFVHGGKVFGFRNATVPGDAYRAHGVPLTAFVPSARTPAIDPVGLLFTPQDLLVADGQVFLLSRKLRNIFRWDPVQRRYLESWGVDGDPTFFQFWPQRHALVVGFSNGRIVQIDLDTGQQRFVTTLAGAVTNLKATGDYIFAAATAPERPHNSMLSVIRDDGTFASTMAYGQFYPVEAARKFVWSDVTRKLHGLWPGLTSNPHDQVRAATIDSLGVISVPVTVGESTRNLSSFCLELSSDATRAVLGTGEIRSLPAFDALGNLPNEITHALWLEPSLLTLRARYHATELEEWNAETVAKVRAQTLPGYPMLLAALDNDVRLAVTLADRRPLFHLLNASLDVIYSGTSPNPPTISLPPSTEIVVAGGALSLRATDNPDPALTFQWFFDGRPIAGANEATLTLPAVQTFQAGAYSVSVGRNTESASSPVVVLNVDPPAPGTGRLVNLSTRGLSLVGEDVLIPGFVVSGVANKRVLIRAAGPALHDLGVSGELNDPIMTLKVRNPSNGTFLDLATNDNWEDNANAVEIAATALGLGAFPLAAGSRDSALLQELAPGTYTVVARGVADGAGVAIVELYDLDPSSTESRLINISNRGFVGTGGDIMIPGIVISSEGPRTLLVRAVGPTLTSFGVTGVLPDPQLKIYQGQALLFENDNWDANPEFGTMQSAAQNLGAFPLFGSNDAALLVTLPPGSYTVHASGVDGSTGVALVEVYLTP